MQDREPTYPGRVTLTPVYGLANTYDMERADRPLQEGTPLNKASLLSDATAAAIKALLASQTENPVTPNDALNILTQAVDAAATKANAVDSRGNCEIYSGSYVGNGSSTTPVTMTFPHKPLIIFVSGRDALNLIAWRGQSGSKLLEVPSTSITVTWGERNVAWSGTNYLNYTGFTHQVIALLAADE